ncbi:tripartite tricarboxylate transporter TctB family protein [Pseudochelatococcus sp. B33]
MKLTKELLSGLMFLALGLGALFMGMQYRLGTATSMGPGYFPVMLSSAVALLGVAIAAKAMLNPDAAQPVTEFHVRPLAIIVAAILAFGLLIDRFGLVVAMAALVAVSRIAIRGRGIVELTVIFVVLTAIAIGIFVFGLNLPLKLRPW